ncbi:MAG: hypothetical protein HFJ49_05260 [Clostridia bacterium]|nr:hypothetical protein [Clostridia bacterium]
MNRETKLKILRIILIMTITVAIVFSIGVIILKYNVEGEINLPFKITKIIMVSSSGGTEKQEHDNMWDIEVSQNNDIYIYIEKNDNYGRTEIIDNIKIDNFKTKKDFEIGEINIYNPSEEGKEIFINTQNNTTTNVIYKGELESNVKKKQISNQGGLVIFRCANDKIGTYSSNEVEEVNYNTLLSNIGVTNEQLKGEVSFDITIELISKKTYKATATLELPVGDVVSNGTTNLEMTDLRDIVFKRVEK